VTRRLAATAPFCALAASLALLAGCGGAGSDGPEQALRGGSVAGVDASSVVDSKACEASNTGAPGVYECRVENQGATRWLECSRPPGEDAWMCVQTGAPTSDHVFTTPEQLAAPKDVTWKCEDTDEHGNEIGPVFVSLLNDPEAPAQQLEWMTKRDARAVARRYHVRLGLDC
jgi:hypothetical protein